MTLPLVPTFSQFCQLAKKGNLIPVYTEFLADTQTPVLSTLKLNQGDYLFLLESVEGQEKWATYSFLGINPKWVLRCQGGEIQIFEGRRCIRKIVQGSPFKELRRMLSPFRPVELPGIPRFQGGAVGFFAYDCIRFIEKIPDENPDEMNLPDALFMITDTLVVFNNMNQHIQIISNAFIPEDARKADLKKSYLQAGKQIQQIRRRLQKNWHPPKRRKKSKTLKSKAILKKEEYERMVRKAKRYVRNGDVIQVVLSNRYQGKTDISPFEIYRALRTINPSPYMYYLNLPDFAIVGSSPETLVRLEDGQIHVRPIAGTRPRGKNEKEDEKLAKQLINDAKECAEHIMLVDLGRNDVGKVAKKGTVTVPELMNVERYSHVMHIVSHVEGQLQKGLDAFDVLAATFPAGTLSGAPKIRAMEIIDELEKSRRGPYGGALGYVSFSGNMDFCITIRTLLFKKKKFYIQAGAGIVADSRPAKEYLECQNKAQALLRALDLAKDID